MTNETEHTYPDTEYRIQQPKEWARIDKDMNVTFLDMDTCAKGPHNNYSVLAIAIWNAAIEAAAEKVGRVWCPDDKRWKADVIRELKK